MARGGYVVDTPGIRQFQLWDVIPAGTRAAISRHASVTSIIAGFPNCTHIHESECAVKNAVADGRLDPAT